MNDRPDAARYARASEHADRIIAAADELTAAIYAASRDGYAAVVRIDDAHPVGDGKFIGSDAPVQVKATIAFDLGLARRL